MNSDKIDKVKSIIRDANTSLVSVSFVKSNGEPRTICFNPKTAKGIKGEKADPSRIQAVETSKKNNPHLIRVCDQSLLAKGDPAEKCWRTVNCEKTRSVKAGGEEWIFE